MIKMKVKTLKNSFFVLVVALLLGFTFFMPILTVSADTLPVQIYDMDKDYYVGEETIEYSDANQAIQLGIRNYDHMFNEDGGFDNEIEVEYQVEYFVLKLNTDAVVYDKIATVDICFDVGELQNQEGHYSYNFFEYGGSGSYHIKANIVRNSVIVAQPEPFTITIKKPTQLSNNLELYITYEKTSTSENEFGTYLLTAFLRANNTPIDISGYQIYWYQESGKKILISKQAVFEWEPSEAGSFRVSAEIPELSNISSRLNITVARDYSTIAIISLLGFAAVLTIFVIIGTARRIKKERIW